MVTPKGKGSSLPGKSNEIINSKVVFHVQETISSTEMKTPNAKKFRSVSEQQLTKVGQLLARQPSEDDRKYYKSETSINKNLIALEDSSSSDSSSSDPQLIPTPRTPNHPKEMLQKCLIKLRSNQWSESVSSLRDVIQISRFNPQLLVKSLPIVYKGIITLLKSLRPTAARTACQAANELFMNMPSVEGPEFDELIHVLLHKTSDGNKSLRKDAVEALDSMIIHVPPSHSMKTLLHRRISGYNSSVRATAAKLLACVFSISGGDPDVSEDTKMKLVMAAVRFSQDDSNEIKFHGMRLVTMLMGHKDYMGIIQKKINVSTLDRITKAIKTVKKCS